MKFSAATLVTWLVSPLGTLADSLDNCSKVVLWGKTNLVGNCKDSCTSLDLNRCFGNGDGYLRNPGDRAFETCNAPTLGIDSRDGYWLYTECADEHGNWKNNRRLLREVVVVGVNGHLYCGDVEAQKSNCP